jgi:hypothetical protein
VWSNQSLAACRCVSESASSGFKGSSIRMMSAPRPVNTPVDTLTAMIRCHASVL